MADRHHPPIERLSEVFTVKVTPSIARRIRHAARAQGKRVSVWLRENLEGAAGRSVVSARGPRRATPVTLSSPTLTRVKS